ncbi:MAG: RNA methyltransferase [Bacteriovoracaceae bacterium]
MKNCYIALVHHPVVNKRAEVVTTSVTNLDIHDIARSARTFGFDGYFIVTPIQKQQALVKNILDHWNTDYGNQYNPDRKDALSFIHLSNTLEEACELIEKRHGAKPFRVVTAAGFKKYDGGKQELCAKLEIDNRPMILIFGTGWGLHASVTENADFRLEPVFGAAKDGYNHLSVRSAVAIYCDRLRGSL